MDFLKIDGSLMQNIASDTMRQDKVRVYVQAAANRAIPVIAERVEDANTMAVLFQLGVAYMQGHYVHEPEVVLADAGR
jgi:EAL domain-containing protein (putative c-di-GMP-specific phosphodiesterase class I)